MYSKEEGGCDSAALECDLAAAGSELEAAGKDWLVASALEVVAIVVAVEATIVPTTKVEVGVEVGVGEEDETPGPWEVESLGWRRARATTR